MMNSNKVSDGGRGKIQKGDSRAKITRPGLTKMPPKGKVSAVIPETDPSICDSAIQPQTQQSMAGVTDMVWKVGCYKINPSTATGE